MLLVTWWHEPTRSGGSEPAASVFYPLGQEIILSSWILVDLNDTVAQNMCATHMRADMYFPSAAKWELSVSRHFFPWQCTFSVRKVLRQLTIIIMSSDQPGIKKKTALILCVCVCVCVCAHESTVWVSRRIQMCKTCMLRSFICFVCQIAHGAMCFLRQNSMILIMDGASLIL